jgi:hypothetical protein
MNSSMMRQHPFLMRIAALVLGVALLLFTVGTQVSYADGDPNSGMNDPELIAPLVYPQDWGEVHPHGEGGDAIQNGSSVAGSIQGDGADAR